MDFETLTKGMQDAQEPLNRNFSAIAAALGNKAAVDFSNLPNPQAALYNLGARPGRNLLDNWYFPRPVNQIGKTEYTAAGYTIDRWRLGTDGAKVALTTGGLVLSKESSAYNYAALGTLFENSESLKGKTVTLSVLTTEGLFTGTGPLLDLSDAHVVYCTYNSDGDIFRAYFSEGLLCAEFIAYGSNAAPVQAAKLELGPVQTLAHQDADGNWVLNDPPPDPALELLKCQRYQVVYTRGMIGWYQDLYTGTGMAMVQTPVTLRATPTVKLNGELFLQKRRSEEYVRVAQANIKAVLLATNSIRMELIDLTTDEISIFGPAEKLLSS